MFPRWMIDPVENLANRWDWLGDKVNAIAIDSLVNVCPHRPYPWSTVHDYVSWTSLTDHQWSARHLPAVHQNGLPAVEPLTNFFKRPDNNRQRLSPKSTCLFPAFAQYLTDGIIRTRMPDSTDPPEVKIMKRKQNTSNHQLDLSPLYGRTPQQTDVLRLKSGDKGRRGRLKSQEIAGEEYAPFLVDGNNVKQEFQDLDLPLGWDHVPVQDRPVRRLFAFGGDRANASPQIAMMNTLFLREHNRLAGALEGSNPSWDDERVFQVARNIVIVLFIKIVVEQYINHIAQGPFRFRADPSVAWNAPWNKPNWITTEFSLLYRWHSLIPDTMTWKGKSYPASDTILNNAPLLDTGLAQGFLDMSSQRAGHLGAFNTPSALLPLEALAIQQGRWCDLAPYVAYRELVSLPKPQAFSEISEDPQVVAFLERAYKSPADVDFYVGLFAEQTVKNSPLPKLLLTMVAVDAFSQALTNPLLSEHVFTESTDTGKGTFTDLGWSTIKSTDSLHNLLDRNSTGGAVPGRISMTWEGWRRS